MVEIQSWITGHHEYKRVWSPVIGQRLICRRYAGNPVDPSAVGVFLGNRYLGWACPMEHQRWHIARDEKGIHSHSNCDRTAWKQETAWVRGSSDIFNFVVKRKRRTCLLHGMLRFSHLFLFLCSVICYITCICSCSCSCELIPLCALPGFSYWSASSVRPLLIIIWISLKVHLSFKLNFCYDELFSGSLF